MKSFSSNDLREIDEFLSRLDKAQSDDELRELFKTFRLEFNTHVPSDPYSQEYRQKQFDLYYKLAGRTYSSANEVSSFDVRSAISRPFPFYTGSCETVGNHLIAIGYLLKVMKLSPGATIVEFGSGWGNTTLTLAKMGFDVTAVDIEPNFCELIEARAKSEGVNIKIINSDFSWIETIQKPVDAILFFESFHHASDHFRLLSALDKATKENGRVFFGAEPITPDFPIPWGLRMDGESIWAIRKHGWLELGYNEKYFTNTLESMGWIVSRHSTDASPWASVFEVRKKSSLNKKFYANDQKLRTQIGKVIDNSALASEGQPGALVYGPYIDLPKGRYKAKIVFDVSRKHRGKGLFDVCIDSGKKVLNSRKIKFDNIDVNKQYLQLDFELRNAVRDLEIRLFCEDGACAAVTAIELCTE